MSQNRFKSPLQIFISCVLALSVWACSGAIGADDDGKPEDAKVFFQDVTVSDSVDQSYQDLRDWRRVHFVQDVQATVTLVMAPADENLVTGRVAVFSSQIQLVGQRDIQPGLGTYELGFSAEAGRDYFILVETRHGKADYRINLETQEKDPCAACGPDEECVDGRCQAISACQSCPSGQVCDEVQAFCVWEKCLGKTCRRGKTCNRQGRCVGGSFKPQCRRDSDCSDDKICRRGRCVRRPPPPCPSGQKRVSGVCQPIAVDGPKYEEVRANVVGIRDAGSGFVTLELDKGYSRGLKLGMPGSVKGRTLKLVSVDRFRSRGKVKGKPRDFSSGQKVIFRVEKRD